MHERFSLFHSHIDLAHKHWKSLVRPGDTVIDATCGNGHDTLFLAGLALTPKTGSLYALDLQPIAIESCRELLLNNLPRDVFEKIHFIEGCHSILPKGILPESTKLIAYNLGYLPGGDKTKTTRAKTTLKSLRQAQVIIQAGGVISVTCYPGHPEGKEEEKAILEYAETLDPKRWSCCHHSWINRKKAPSLLFIQKRLPTHSHNSTIALD
ncbi:MAG: class I SAM-dependent methyltransferase [Waddliaceae bacterium]